MREPVVYLTGLLHDWDRDEPASDLVLEALLATANVKLPAHPDQDEGPAD